MLLHWYCSVCVLGLLSYHFDVIYINPSVYFRIILFTQTHGHSHEHTKILFSNKHCSVCCRFSKSSLSPAPLIVIMLQMLCLFFLACTGGNINFRELNKHIQLFRMKDTDFPRHVVILRWQAMVREKIKIKIFSFIGLNALSLCFSYKHKHTLFTLTQKAKNVLLLHLDFPLQSTCTRPGWEQRDETEMRCKLFTSGHPAVLGGNVTLFTLCQSFPN